MEFPELEGTPKEHQSNPWPCKTSQKSPKIPPCAWGHFPNAPGTLDIINMSFITLILSEYLNY